MGTVLIDTIRERNAKTGLVEDIVNRAFDADTGRVVVLPCETPQSLGARWNDAYGMWTLSDLTPKLDPRARAA